MWQPDNASSVTSKPAYGAAGTPGWLTSGSIPQSEVFNHIIAELKAILDEAGVSLDKADDAQIVEVVKGAFATMADATDTTSTSTVWTRLIMAATGCQASGDKSLVGASNGCTATAEESAVLASDGSNATGIDTLIAACLTAAVSGDRATAIASEAAVVSGDRAAAIASDTCEVTGNDSAAIASDTTLVPGSQSANIASGSSSSAQQLRSANIATTGAIAGNVAGSQNNANLATNATTVRGIQNAAVASALTTVGDAAGATREAAAIACYDGSIETDRSAMMGCYGCDIPSGANDNNVILASVNVDASTHASGPSPAPQYSVLGGNGTDGWRLEGATGNIKASGTVAGGGLDIAEFFKALEEIPLGCFTAYDATAPGKNRTAREGDQPHGITSANPTILGGDDTFGWQGKHLRDEWGVPLYDDVEVVSWRGYEGPADLAPAHSPSVVEHYDIPVAFVRWDAYDGPLSAAPCTPPATSIPKRKIIRKHVSWPAYDGPAKLAPAVRRPGNAEEYSKALPGVRWPEFHGPLAEVPCTPPETAKLRTEQRPRINPAFDPARQHTPRSQRPGEHAKIGLLGQFRLRVTADVVAGMRVVPTDGGKGRPIAEGETTHGAYVQEIVQAFDAEKGYAIAWVFFNARS